MTSSDPATPASRVPRQDNRRQHLLDSAARLFRERGYRATSMRDIAKAVGMLSGSIYYHFTSKEEILQAVYETGLRHISDRFDNAVAGETDPWRRLEAGCVAHMVAVHELSDYSQVMIRVLPQEGGSVAVQLLELRDQYEARFRRLIDALDLPPGTDRHYLRLMLIGGMNWSHVWYHPGRDSPADVAQRMVALIRNGYER
ncbi:MAG TPA: TetR/AcrR family transcriptional regulator [Candidatus Binataceae bacterium]|nr:TetR/AcrR family transcriptional regulator [Candidatus Binataceae bacterium]